MKKPIYIVILVFGLLLLSINVKAEQTEIVCTNSVLADFTNNIINENVTIEYICEECGLSKSVSYGDGFPYKPPNGWGIYHIHHEEEDKEISNKILCPSCVKKHNL